jgi:hypothetical protein
MIVFIVLCILVVIFTLDNSQPVKLRYHIPFTSFRIPALSFKLTEEHLEKLRHGGIPDGVLEDLEILKGQNFTKDNFWKAVEKQIGEEETILYVEK